MHAFPFFSALLLVGSNLVAALDESSLVKYVDSLALDFACKPVKEAYWTGFPHHRRTPFAVSPDGKSAYVAYLDSSETDVHVQKVDVATFTADGAAVTIKGGKEAGGLVAHDDGFALLTNEALPSGTANAPPDNTPVPVLYRYTNGQQSWKTYLGGPGVHESDGLSASPDLNGDLVYSASADLYGAYFVVTDYAGWAAGHFGDSVEYVSGKGVLQTIQGASSSWGCSHNTGIAFEDADAAPFASICAEDQGDIWLNTKTQSMSGVKISNENTTNGGSGEPMGGMSGSYSGLARFQNSDSYIFTWVSRGAINLKANTWMGDGYTQADARTSNRNVAVATFADKYTLNGPEAISTVGAPSGDDQINWITTGSADRSNAHVATFDGSNALITWEEIAEPTCDFVAMGCSGTFTGSYFQQVDSKGTKIGKPFMSMDTYVAGDMVTFPDAKKICWPYIHMTWSLDANADTTSTSKAMSFACISLGQSNSTSSATTSKSSSSAPTSTTSSANIPKTSWSATSSTTSSANIPKASSAPTSTTSSANIPKTSWPATSSTTSSANIPKASSSASSSTTSSANIPRTSWPAISSTTSLTTAPKASWPAPASATSFVTMYKPSSSASTSTTRSATMSYASPLAASSTTSDDCYMSGWSRHGKHCKPTPQPVCH